MWDNRVVFRRALSLLPWLLAGLIISLAVAWSMPWLAGNRSVALPLSGDIKSMWRDHAPHGYPAEPQLVHTVTAVGSDMLSMMYVHPRTNLVAHIQRDRVGWPLRSMESWMWSDRLSSSGRTGSVEIGDRLYPSHPLWPGLAVNMLTFTLGVLLAFRVPCYLRGLWRLHRFRCDRCGYPTGTNARCTECGTPLPAWSRDRAQRTFTLVLWRHRRSTFIMLLLVAGMLTTVLSAAVLALVAPSCDSPRLTLNDPGEVEWVRSHTVDPAMERLQDVRTRATFGLEKLFVGIAGGEAQYLPNLRSRTPARTYVCRYRAGWPLYALEGVDWVGVSDPVNWPRRISTSADALFLPRRGAPTVIPLRPLWPGLAVNTLIWSSLIGLGTWIRAKAGRRGSQAEES